eukprot:7542606-Pyramimonas_sp.AAC.1
MEFDHDLVPGSQRAAEDAAMEFDHDSLPGSQRVAEDGPKGINLLGVGSGYGLASAVETLARVTVLGSGGRDCMSRMRGMVRLS